MHVRLIVGSVLLGWVAPLAGGAESQYHSADLVPNHGQETAAFLVQPGLEVNDIGGAFETAADMALLPENDSPGARAIIVELRGAIHLWLRDGSFVTVAEDADAVAPFGELPNPEGETGQAGVCVGPDGRTVFTTSVYHAGLGKRNEIKRWRLGVDDAGDPRLHLEQTLRAPFVTVQAKLAHQIGHCTVGPDAKLWVGTGDGWDVPKTHDPEHGNGKILRLNLDLSAPRDNPFYTESRHDQVESLVWAMGFRNPFSLTFVGERAIVADNGPNIDRLIDLERGRDYPWDGSNLSFTYQTLLTLIETVGPADILYVPPDHPLTPLRGQLIVVASHKAALIGVPFHPDRGILGPPRYVLQGRFGPRKQDPHDFTSAQLGTDSLYITHIRMNRQTTIPSPILKVSLTEEGTDKVAHFSGDRSMQVYACRSCHVVAGKGAEIGPSLDGVVARLEARLTDAAYLDRLRARNAAAPDPALDRVRQTLFDQEGSLEARVRLWLATKIRHPDFERPGSGMAQLDLSDAQTDDIVDYLLTISPRYSDAGMQRAFTADIVDVLERMPLLQLLVVFVVALCLGLFIRTAGRMLLSVLEGTWRLCGRVLHRRDA